MAKPDLAVQSIIFGERNSTDFDGVLEDVAAAGYPAIEAGNLYASHGKENVINALARHGLRVAGAHFGYNTYGDDALLHEALAYAKEAGIKYMMCSGVGDGSSVEGYKASARRFNEVGRLLADNGVKFNYHNHDWEFKDLGGSTGMDVLLQETDPAFVMLNIDVFWLWYARQDVTQFIRANASRAGYFHFKDGKRLVDADGKSVPQFLELGSGDVDLKGAYSAVVETAGQWVVTEQDRTQLTARESLTISRSFLKSALGL